ncbi:MAG: tRNA (N6-isopentenyl adenosine(37)-C2)-methylthiotransferase MiaB [Spirochaetaceae bacterium]|jgi:tRNA-2-methylthio-N6-dimethylallyladenosine synthase|nr:tRNA (N6-isopentenyl adenosine(37)-C2)-methylthiotransferase MiaB [Spirochaetaceae bacterium]
MKYYLLVLGCQMNLSDSERIKSIFNSMGFSETQEEKDAQILGVVACSVRQKAIDKVFNRIHKWNQQKKTKNLLTFLTGCILEDDKKKFLKLFDLVFQTKEMAALPEMIGQYGVVTPASLKNQLQQIPQETQGDFWQINPEYQSKYEAYIPIQNGCNKFCTYCAVPYTRGREESRPSGEILDEFDSLMSRGFHNVTLLGQNVNSYGLDKKGTELTFPHLLEQLALRAEQQKQKPWIYFTSPHPRDMTDEVIEVMAKYPSLAKQIHLPLQSGDDKILGDMNRSHNLQDYRRIVETIRKKLPQATLFTDIIVGFPGEEEEHFMNSLRAMEEFEYNMAFIACYSPRPGAKSSRWEDTVSQQIKKERLHRLTEVLMKTSGQWNQRQIGRETQMLVTGPSRKGDRINGRTEGMVNIQIPMDQHLQAGDRISVEITGAMGLSLEAVKK